jgi:diacylglycerol O-acyltransferase
MATHPGPDRPVGGHGRQGRTPVIERLEPGDLAQLASDVGPVAANVGVLMILEPAPQTDPAQLEEMVARRLVRVPRLRQRMVQPPRGLGRPYWADDPDLDPGAHVTRIAIPAPGDREALLAAAVDAVVQPLARDRPLWRAVVITGLRDGRLGLVVVIHHVVADGVSALAVLVRLADDGRPDQPVAITPTRPGPGPGPGPLVLFLDTVAARSAALRGLPCAVMRLGRSGVGLGLARGRAAPRCSLNVPTGPRRRLATVDVDLAALQAAGRRHRATVNDVLLVAAAAALSGALERRDELVADLVISVPVSSRTTATDAALGNRVGVMAIRVPVRGPVLERLSSVTRATQLQKTHARGPSGALVGPVFRVLAALGIYQWCIDRQRLVNSFLTNIRGPVKPLAVAGLDVREMIPITIAAGNIGIAFAAVSYAGTLTVTVVTDPDIVPGVEPLADALRAEIEALVRA